MPDGRRASDGTKSSTRLGLLLATLCALMLAIGMFGLSGMKTTHTDLQSVDQDRVVPLKQIKLVSDAYAVDVGRAALHRATSPCRLTSSPATRPA